MICPHTSQAPSGPGAADFHQLGHACVIVEMPLRSGGPPPRSGPQKTSTSRASRMGLPFIQPFPHSEHAHRLWFFLQQPTTQGYTGTAPQPRVRPPKSPCPNLAALACKQATAVSRPRGLNWLASGRQHIPRCAGVAGFEIHRVRR